MNEECGKPRVLFVIRVAESVTSVVLETSGASTCSKGMECGTVVSE